MDIKREFKAFVIRHFLSYDGKDLVRDLRRLGIRQGDTVMVHASWLPQNGFNGKPSDFLRALQDAVGASGLLAMPSLTYQNMSSREFLERNKPMDVRRSPSSMGLLSEVFRRTRGVRRSLSPTHPLLAWGERSEAFLAGHNAALVPFGRGSPFERLLEARGKILAVDAPFSTITFTHFLEDRIAHALPFELYEPAPRTGSVVDAENHRHEIPVKVLADQANALRREERLLDVLKRRRLLRGSRIGNTRLLVIEAAPMTACVDELVAGGWSFFDAP